MRPGHEAVARKAFVDALHLALPSAGQGLVDALALDLGSQVLDLAAAPKPVTLTRVQARKQATDLADLAARLGRELAGSEIASQLGMVGRIVNGTGGLDDAGLQQLMEMLAALRRDAHALLRATGDDEQVPQLQLPGRGDTTDAAARRVAHVVLRKLYLSGADITTTERGPAVQCVAAAFALTGIEADARHAVRGWVDRHPEQPPQ